MILDIDAIQEVLPHRYPFLLVDRILELEPGKRAVGIKQVSAGEPWTQGHFPGRPIMPGVLIAEALAQVAAIVFLSSSSTHEGSHLYLVGMDKMRFRKLVRPGETLRLEVSVATARRRMWKFDALATVDGERAATGTLLASGDRTE